MEFHRVVSGFVIQGGKPSANGWGGPVYNIVSKFSLLNYYISMIGMASAGINTEGSQWFLCTEIIRTVTDDIQYLLKLSREWKYFMKSIRMKKL
jgi:cyclophilin family peptidyl-prolyl cis-trans isomerase